MSRPAMNPTEARACEVCKHWKPITEEKGRCLKMPWNVEYENPETGERQFVEYWTTGCYATCPQWDLREKRGERTNTFTTQNALHDFSTNLSGGVESRHVPTEYGSNEAGKRTQPIASSGSCAPPAQPNLPVPMGIDKLPDFHAAIWFNGWLAGIINPVGRREARSVVSSNIPHLVAPVSSEGEKE